MNVHKALSYLKSNSAISVSEKSRKSVRFMEATLVNLLMFRLTWRTCSQATKPFIFSGSGGNTDREMDGIGRNVVQNGADNRFTNCDKVIITDNNHRPANTIDAENITLLGSCHLPDFISLRLAPVNLADTGQFAPGFPTTFFQCFMPKRSI